MRGHERKRQRMKVRKERRERERQKERERLEPSPENAGWIRGGWEVGAAADWKGVTLPPGAPLTAWTTLSSSHTAPHPTDRRDCILTPSIQLINIICWSSGRGEGRG